MEGNGAGNCLRRAGPHLPQSPASSRASWPCEQEMGMAGSTADWAVCPRPQRIQLTGDPKAQPSALFLKWSPTSCFRGRKRRGPQAYSNMEATASQPQGQKCPTLLPLGVIPSPPNTGPSPQEDGWKSPWTHDSGAAPFLL